MRDFLDERWPVIAWMCSTLMIAVALLQVQDIAKEHNELRVRVDKVERVVSPCRTAYLRNGLEGVRKDRLCTLQANLLFVNVCFHHPRLPACVQQRGLGNLSPEMFRGVGIGGGNGPSGPPGGDGTAPKAPPPVNHPGKSNPPGKAKGHAEQKPKKK